MRLQGRIQSRGIFPIWIFPIRIIPICILAAVPAPASALHDEQEVSPRLGLALESPHTRA